MQIFYKCSCMDKEAELSVPHRREGADLLEWMELVQGIIGFDHRNLSPMCRATKLEYAKIPYEESAGGVGMQPVKQ